jgi:hypothetical protein
MSDYIKLPELVSLGDPVKGTSRTWNFSFKHCGWAIFTLNDGTGEFSITSDWGNYSHRWNVNHLGGGATLTQFIANAGPEYIATKFSYEKGEGFREQFDPDETFKALKKLIIDERRNYAIDKEETRELWDQLVEWGENHLLGATDPNQAIADLSWWEELNKWLDCPWDHFCWRPSGAYLFLTQRLLPFFQQYLRRTEV